MIPSPSELVRLPAISHVFPDFLCSVTVPHVITGEHFDGDELEIWCWTPPATNKIGKNIQLSAKFMNVSSGEVIKGSNVHGKFPDEIFTLQEQLAKDLTDKISGKSASQQKNRIEEYSNSTGNFTAYQYYIKGRMEQIQYDVKNYPVAIEYYNKALKYDPKYALAWAGLADVNALWGYQIQYANGNSAPYLKIAIEHGLKAVEYGPNLYQTHRALSMAYLNNSDFENSQKEIDEAYKLNRQD